jgi:hypothetical protein
MGSRKDVLCAFNSPDIFVHRTNMLSTYLRPVLFFLLIPPHGGTVVVRGGGGGVPESHSNLLL